MATESYVQVATDGSGKKVRSVEVTSIGTPDTGVVEQQVVSLADVDGVAMGPLTQGAAGTTATGPMVQGVVNDTPNSYVAGELRPMSMTPEGRLRVSTAPSYIDDVWNMTFDGPWAAGAGWSVPSAGQAGMSWN